MDFEVAYPTRYSTPFNDAPSATRQRVSTLSKPTERKYAASVFRP